MRGWNWGLAAATLLLGAGASNSLADDPCGDDGCEGASSEEQAAARRNVDNANTAIRSAASTR